MPGVLLLGVALQTIQLPTYTIAREIPGEPLLEAQILATSLIPDFIPDNKPSIIKIAVTGYSSTPDQTDSTPFITASGKHVREGIVAANFLPFGAKIRMPEIFGDKIFTVEDRMNRRYFHRVDVWFASREAALKFGKKIVEIEIL